MPPLDLVLWALTTLLSVGLLGYVFLRGQQAKFPFFVVYLAINLGQFFLQATIYRQYGFNSRITYVSVWSLQGLVVVARALAATELCHHVLGRYLGVWALAIRLLLAAGLMVFGLAVYFGRDGFQYAVVTLEIGVEAFIAVLVIGTFLFARYYQVAIESGLKLLGLGFGFYSCLKILNDLILARYLNRYANTWNAVGISAFVLVLLAWIWAMKKATVEESEAPQLAPVQLYRALVPEVNRRLYELNEQLIRLWKLEPPKP
jgi:hypothetical protein